MDFQFLEKAPVLETLSGQQSEDMCISVWTSSSNVKLDSRSQCEDFCGIWNRFLFLTSCFYLSDIYALVPYDVIILFSAFDVAKSSEIQGTMSRG